MRLSLLTFLRPSGLAALAAALVLQAPAAAAPAGPGAPPSVAAAGAEEPRPAIWLLSDEDTKIYLFGTVHMLPPGFKWRSQALDRIIEEADELVVETYEAPGSGDYADAHKALMLAKPSPILFRVAPEHRKRLKAAIQASQVPVKYYDMMQTWAAAMMLGMAQLLGSYGADDPSDAPGVEDVLEEVFRDAGKPIGSVEHPGDVVASLNAIPAEAQAALLIDTLGESSREGLDESAAQDRMWARGQVEEMTADLFDDFPPALFDALLTRRNRAWTGWLAERLQKPGTILFAVGAGHLGGRDSVQQMLAARGLEVKRIH